jgi:hypothetical protein
MSSKLKITLLSDIRDRHQADGSLKFQVDGDYRPDATAWAILALRAAGMQSIDLKPARTRLLEDQLADGRLAISPQHPQAYWPTSLAVLAWHQDPEFHATQVRAVHFLLNSTGRQYPKPADAPYDHDSTLKGWSWIEGTHAWVIPSALAIIALKAVGYSEHQRVQEATRLLLDRQLPRGGWNYGNTRVYGQELNPMVETTGVALQALAGSVPRQEINKSLIYLNKAIFQTGTPLSLSWGLLGLGTWGEESPERESWLGACWSRQTRYGGYDANAIALMILALSLPQGILSLFNLPG